MDPVAHKKGPNMETAIEKIRREFDALPQWAKNLVAGLRGGASYSISSDDKHTAFQIILKKENIQAWLDGFFEMCEVAAAISAPYPAHEPEPHAEMTTDNLVEMVSNEDECAFDQPCHYGNRVGSHAVYCHNDMWPDSPPMMNSGICIGGPMHGQQVARIERVFYVLLPPPKARTFPVRNELWMQPIVYTIVTYTFDRDLGMWLIDGAIVPHDGYGSKDA